MTISKEKLLEWVRQQQGIVRSSVKYESNYPVTCSSLHAQLDCWNLITATIEAGDFDE